MKHKYLSFYLFNTVCLTNQHHHSLAVVVVVLRHYVEMNELNMFNKYTIFMKCI